MDQSRRAVPPLRPMVPPCRRMVPLPGRDGRIPLACLYAGYAAFAGLVAALSGLAVHRLWGEWAAGGYAAAALCALLWRTRGAQLASWVAVAGAVACPLAQFGMAGRNLPEVTVIERAARLLLHHGTPYLTQPQLAGHGFMSYDPYLPAMTVFGLPHAVFGGGLATDPRLWAGAAFVTLIVAALRVAGSRPAAGAAAFLVASPLVAFPLAVSGNDLPVAGLICLGLALALAPAPAGGRAGGRAGGAARRAALAGVALGAAAAMKATAWPALAVVAVALKASDARADADLLTTLRIPRGRGAAGAFLLAAGCTFLVLTGPLLALQPAAVLRNTVLFPLGAAGVASPAASPLPGHLLAATGPAGHTAAVVLLAAAGAAVATSLVIRPPASLRAATLRVALGLALMFALAPATRWGYFAYPGVLLAWLWLGGAAGGRPGRWAEWAHGRCQRRGRGAAAGVCGTAADHRRGPVPDPQLREGGQVRRRVRRGCRRARRHGAAADPRGWRLHRREARRVPADRDLRRP